MKVHFFRSFALCTFLAFDALLAGCGALAPQKIEVQQGNFISAELARQLKPGMSKEQVRFILGTPLVTDIFHAERWDYVFYRDPRDGGREQHKLAVFFQDGRLVRLAGDVAPAEFRAADAAK